MSDERLSVPERSALLALMTFVTEASNTEIHTRYRFTIEKGVRERLTQLGYITTYRSGGNKPYRHELTEAGWRRCREELSAPAPDRAHRAYRLLYGVLHILDAHLRRSGSELADVFVPSPDSSAPARPVANASDTQARVRAEYQDLAAEPGAWVSLTRLRSALSDLPRPEVDQALLHLGVQPRVHLIPESNQKVLSDADRAAAVRVGGEEMHLLAIDRP